MEQNLLDKHFKDKLSNYASPVPQGMWERIAAEKDRKPKVIWWWNNKSFLLIGILAITASIVGFVQYQNEKHESPKVTSTLNNKNNNLTEESVSINTNQKAAIEKTVVQNASSTSNTAEQQNKSTILEEANKEKTNKKSTATHYTQNKTNKNNYNSNLSEGNFTSPNTNKSVSTKKEFEKEDYNAKSSISNSNNNSNSLDESKTIEEIKKYNFGNANILKLNISKQNGLINKTIDNKKFEIRDCPSVDNRIRKDLFLEVYTAPEYTKKTVQATNPLYTNYANLKDSAESMVGGFTVGMRLATPLNKNWLLKAGLQYSQINERFSLQKETNRRTIVVVTTRTETDALGNTTIISDTTKYQQVDYSYTNGVGYYKNLELPVMLTYQFNSFSNTKLSLNAGLIINLSSWYKGTVISPTYQLLNVSKQENADIYKTKVGLSFVGSLNISKVVNERLDLFAEPYFRFNITNNQQSSYDIKQKFSAIGLSLGLKYNLHYSRNHF